MRVLRNYGKTKESKKAHEAAWPRVLEGGARSERFQGTRLPLRSGFATLALCSPRDIRPLTGTAYSMAGPQAPGSPVV